MKATAKSLRVLVVEDNVVNQRLATTLLSKLGYHPVVASSGPQALAILSKEVFDVILMDVQMPEMDGLEVTARIRSEERATRNHIPIIALTAHAMPGDRERFLAAGMDGYLSKPIKRELLQEVLSGIANPCHR